MELFNSIYLDKHCLKHLYVQLFESIRDMILEGGLKPEEKLPPIRQLSDLLNINTSTVVNCYNLLEKEGYVYKKVGSGTFVSPKQMSGIDASLLEKYPLDEDFRMMDRGQMQIKVNTISFASATPTSDLFPVEDFKILINEVLDRDKGDAFGYQESQGYYPLRESLVDYLKSYNIDTSPDNIQIISGAQQGIDVISKAFINFKDSVVLENPTYTGAIATFKTRGANIITVPILSDGLDIEALQKIISEQKPKLIYIMSNYQNPTGNSYNLEKKKKLIELAQRYDFLIVEDDYLSDLSFYNNDSSTIKSLDTSDSVIYIKSFSKIFMPGLRLGFLVIPQKILNLTMAAKHTSDISTSGLNQRVFDLYLRKGIWRKHIQYMETIYKKRFDVMLAALKKYILPLGVSFTPPKGGLNFWLQLPHGLSSNDLYIEAEKNNVLILPGSIFYVFGTDYSFFRISIAAVYPDEIEHGIKILSESIAQCINRKKVTKRSTSSFTPIL